MNAGRLFAVLDELVRRRTLDSDDAMVAGAILSGVAVWPEEADDEDVRDARELLSRATGRGDALAARAERIACLRLIHGRHVSTVRAIRETTRVGAQ